MYWELWISQLTRTGKHCMLVRNKGRAVCVSVCDKVRYATQALTVSAACSCRIIKLCKTSLCFFLTMLCLLFIMIISCLIYRDIFYILP